MSLSDKEILNLMVSVNLHKYKSKDGLYRTEDIPTEEWIKVEDVRATIQEIKNDLKKIQMNMEIVDDFDCGFENGLACAIDKIEDKVGEKLK